MISVVTLLAYDYKYLKDSITSYYNIADEIILGLDINRKSWRNQPFELDNGYLNSIIKEIDKDNKIRIIESDFYKFENAMSNEVFERNYLSQFCKKENWILSIDVDERLIDSNSFKSWLENAPKSHDIGAKWLGVFKIIDGKKLSIDAEENTVVATYGQGQYKSGRKTGKQMIQSPLKLEHYSWGRTSEELWQKLNNWGHSQDFDIKKFFDLWNSINLDNYKLYKNIHPLNGVDWPSLKLID